MDLISSQFMDTISGRVPKFKKVTSTFPKIETDVYEWKCPLKEGKSKDDFDEVTMRVGTTHEGILFTERYVITQQDIPRPEIMQYLERLLTERVNKYLSE